jgi:hypothetical protein
MLTGERLEVVELDSIKSGNFLFGGVNSMKNHYVAAAVILSAFIATPAAAQSFTHETTWEPVESVGGLTGPEGRQYGGGSVKGTYVTTMDDGTVTKGTVRCVGLGQPDGGIFAIHLSCTAKDDQASYMLAYGCNYVGKPGPDTPLGCIGGMEGKGGPTDKMRGSVTMFWYADLKAKGTGQWYVAP